MQIALALIKRLVANGQLDADDVSEMCADLSEADRNAVMAAWIEGVVSDSPQEPERPKPSLSLLNGGKSEP